MIENPVFFVGLIALILATITDIKRREVPDWINYGLIFFGIIYAIILSLLQKTTTPIILTLVGLGIGYLIGAFMFYTGQWGGGDAKMLMGLGSLLGLNYQNIISDTFVNLNLNILLAGAIYGLMWGVIVSIIKMKLVKQKIKDFIMQPEQKRIRIKLYILSSLLILTAIILVDYTAYFASLSIMVLLTYFLFVYIKSVEQATMLKKLKPNQLTEGDWIAQEVRTGGKVFLKKKILTEKDIRKLQDYNKKINKVVLIKRLFYTTKKSLSQIKKGDKILIKNEFVKTNYKLSEEDVQKIQIYLRQNLLHDATIKGKLIPIDKLVVGTNLDKDIKQNEFLVSGPQDLGIEVYQIKEIEKLYKQKKLNTILVKEGIPFIPSFLIAYLATFYLPKTIEWILNNMY